MPESIPQLWSESGGFGFEFSNEFSEDLAWKRGRYLSGVGFAVIPERSDPSTGSFYFTLRSGTHRPRTVRSASLSVQADLTLLQFAKQESVRAWNSQDVGLICHDSSAQAPNFSRWTECERIFEEHQQP